MELSREPETEKDLAVLTGSAPVSEMRGYQKEFAAYTGGLRANVLHTEGLRCVQ